MYFEGNTIQHITT